MGKIIAMIPARLGSKRVKKKNLRLICGRPLVSYIIESAVAAGAFDSIYLNSEAEIFGEIADGWGINFYKRPEHLASDTATNDEFAYDFMKNVKGDILIQLLATSPLLDVSEIRGFVSRMVEDDYDTLVSVRRNQIACIYKGEPVNFDRRALNPPSQTMEPVYAYASALMGWKYGNFIGNMNKYGCAYHGGDGKIGYYELSGFSTVDIDREDEFELAETLLRGKSRGQEAGDSQAEPRYYGE